MDDQISDPNAREKPAPDDDWSPSDGRQLRRRLIAEARAAIAKGRAEHARRQAELDARHAARKATP